MTAHRGKCELGNHGGYPRTPIQLYWACPGCIQTFRRNQEDDKRRHAENMKALSLYNAEYKAVYDAEMKRMRPYRYIPYAFLLVILIVWFT